MDHREGSYTPKLLQGGRRFIEDHDMMTGVFKLKYSNYQDLVLDLKSSQEVKTKIGNPTIFKHVFKKTDKH